MLLVGLYFAYCIFQGTPLLFVAMRDRFEGSAADTALAFSLCSTITNVGGTCSSHNKLCNSNPFLFELHLNHFHYLRHILYPPLYSLFKRR